MDIHHRRSVEQSPLRRAVRITKAETVLSFIDRIRKIAEAVRFEAILDSMEKSRKIILEQTNQYLTGVIDPELSGKIPKRVQARTTLKGLDAKIDKLQNRNADISWLRDQRESTHKTLSEPNAIIARLASQKSRIQGFERALWALPKSWIAGI